MKFMPLREFLRGGYQQITEVTVITSRGYPSFTVFPGQVPVRANKPLETHGIAQGQSTKRA